MILENWSIVINFIDKMLILAYFIITRNYKIEGKIAKRSNSNKEIERAWKIFHIFFMKV